VFNRHPVDPGLLVTLLLGQNPEQRAANSTAHKTQKRQDEGDQVFAKAKVDAHVLQSVTR